MIKAEKTLNVKRLNLVDTDLDSGDDKHFIRQISEEEAMYLLRSLLDIFLPEIAERTGVKERWQI